MRWSAAWTIKLQPKKYLEEYLEWHRGTYEQLRKENIESMPHVILARVLLEREKKEPGPNLVDERVKDLSWACEVTKYWACLPPAESLETMALFTAFERRASLVNELPETMARYNELMEILAAGVDNNSLVDMYKGQNLEPINEEKVFYDSAVEKLFIKTICVSELEH